MSFRLQKDGAELTEQQQQQVAAMKKKRAQEKELMSNNDTKLERRHSLSDLSLVEQRQSVAGNFMHKEGEYDNHYPRLQQARLQGIGARAVAAHQNSFESLLVFATAALTAIATNHVSTAVQILAVIYIVSRVLYSFFYIMDMALLRSTIWGVGFICCLVILILCMI